MPVTEITNKKEFDEMIQKYPVVLLEAHASWCGPCRAIGPVFAKHSDEYVQKSETAIFAKFDTDNVPDLSEELGIRSIPAFFAFKNGEKVDYLSGANPPALQKLCATVIESE